MIDDRLDDLSALLRRETENLPNNIELLSIGGQSIFRVYGTSGGICASLIFYLVKKGLTARDAVEVPLTTNGIRPGVLLQYLNKGVQRFDETLRRLEDTNGFYVNMDGGDLGRESRCCPLCGREK